MKLIDKDALVAEIERRKNLYPKGGQGMVVTKILKDHYEALLSFLNTLEVKENNLLTEKKTEKELAEIYINIFDKKFGNKLPRLKGKQLAEFKNFINTCEQTFCMKYFDYHATQGKLFEKLALLWAVWGKEHLNLEVKEVDFEKELDSIWFDNKFGDLFDNSAVDYTNVREICKYFFELGMSVGNKAQKGEKV